MLAMRVCGADLAFSSGLAVPALVSGGVNGRQRLDPTATTPRPPSANRRGERRGVVGVKLRQSSQVTSALWEDEPMTSWKSLLALLFVSACAVENPNPQKEAQVRAQAQALAPKPVRITDAEAEKKLAGVKLSEPRLCDGGCWDRDPALFTDLDAFIRSECAKDPSACPRAPSDGALSAQAQAGEAGQVR